MKTILINYLAIIVLLVSCTKQQETINETSTTINPEIDAYIEAVMQADEIPGMAVAILKNGTVLHKSNYGYANLAHKVAVSDSTVFRVYSTTKMMTAVGIFQLIEQGKISLNDSISKYIFSLPKAWKSIQIQHLLTHSSGLPDYKDVEFHENLTDAEILKELTSQELRFEKGDHFEYNQTGYWFLLKIIEKVTGKPFDTFILENQLSNNHSQAFFASNSLASYANRVAKYVYNTKLQRYEMSTFAAGNRSFAGNGLNITLNEFIEWNKKFDNNTLLKSAIKAQLLSPFTYKNDPNSDFLIGWDVYQINKKLSYGFSGGGVVDFKKFESGLTIIIMSNGFKYRPRMANMMRYIAGIVDSKLNDVQRNRVEKIRLSFLNNSFQKGVQKYEIIKQEDPNQSFEATINRLGYDFLSTNETEKAINLLTLNTNEYPTSWNAFDSLGEAYLIAGNTKLAIKNYQKSIALNSENSNAIKVLENIIR